MSQFSQELCKLVPSKGLIISRTSVFRIIKIKKRICRRIRSQKVHFYLFVCVSRSKNELDVTRSQVKATVRT